MDKVRFMVPMVDDHIRMSMSELNDEEDFTTVIELEENEDEEGPVDDGHPEYL